MDPLSISASAVSIGQLVAVVSKSLYDFTKHAINAETEVETLRSELSTLTGHLSSIDTTLRKCRPTPSRAPVENHVLVQGDLALEHCAITLTKLQTFLERVGTCSGGLWRVKVAFNFSVHGKELEGYRTEISKSNAGLLTMLSVLNVSLSLQAHHSVSRIAAALDTLKASADEAKRKSQHPTKANIADDMLSRNLRKLADAATRFHSDASTTAGSVRDQSSVVSSTPAGSVYGDMDTMTPTAAKRLKDYLSKDEYVDPRHRGNGRLPTEASAPDSPLDTLIDSEDGRERAHGSILNEWSFKMQLPKMEVYEDLAWKCMMMRDFTGAIQFLEAAISESQQAHQAVSIETHTRLALCHLFNHDREKVLKLIVSLPLDIEVCNLMHALALAYLAECAFDQARAWGEKAFCTKRKLLGDKDVETMESQWLLAKIYEISGDIISFLALKRSMPDGIEFEYSHPRDELAFIVKHTKLLPEELISFQDSVPDMAELDVGGHSNAANSPRQPYDPILETLRRQELLDMDTSKEVVFSPEPVEIIPDGDTIPLEQITTAQVRRGITKRFAQMLRPRPMGRAVSDPPRRAGPTTTAEPEQKDTGIVSRSKTVLQKSKLSLSSVNVPRETVRKTMSSEHCKLAEDVQQFLKVDKPEPLPKELVDVRRVEEVVRQHEDFHRRREAAVHRQRHAEFLAERARGLQHLYSSYHTTSAQSLGETHSFGPAELPDTGLKHGRDLEEEASENQPVCVSGVSSGSPGGYGGEISPYSALGHTRPERGQERLQPEGESEDRGEAADDEVEESLSPRNESSDAKNDSNTSVIPDDNSINMVDSDDNSVIMVDPDDNFINTVDPEDNCIKPLAQRDQSDDEDETICPNSPTKIVITIQDMDSPEGTEDDPPPTDPLSPSAAPYVAESPVESESLSAWWEEYLARREVNRDMWVGAGSRPEASGSTPIQSRRQWSPVADDHRSRPGSPAPTMKQSSPCNSFGKAVSLKPLFATRILPQATLQRHSKLHLPPIQPLTLTINSSLSTSSPISQQHPRLLTQKTMATCRPSRDARLASLHLEYPLWLFDVDQGPWPRKHVDILPGSRPAKITGWYAWPWEYGTGLKRVNDELPDNVMDTSKEGAKPPAAVQPLLDQLRYDDRFQPDSFRVVFEDGSGRSSRDLAEFVFDKNAKGYVAPARILRVERKWDQVPVWDRETGEALFQSESLANMAYGIASLVHNDDELVHAAGVKPTDDGSSIRKAEFQLLDDESYVKGIVYPRRWQKERGLALNLGPDSDWNKGRLAGTLLEGRPWSEVEDFYRDERGGPLL
ncbi:hypothetical protein CDD80_1539 [Ophiocordyceps camponoti-rufipedis]|uniref:Fungal N-terminal domain-containing protein n=1 Tax=Ophiocordyceps camponoti-rufipedis TaxID=2004952 RepID=A0A2C5Z9H1_9HYPO|nr:hypothetical protein CDD80_1539 [Ophiocordyceps camponoti-rufipedis]